MNLTEKQKNVIRQIRCLDYSDIEMDGKALSVISGKTEEFIIPQFGEIQEKVFSAIKASTTVTKLTRCSPEEANCIIRIFQDLHHKHDWDFCYNIYGAECYTKRNGFWLTSDGISAYGINFECCRFRLPLEPDDSLLVDAKFVDCFIRID